MLDSAHDQLLAGFIDVLHLEGNRSPLIDKKHTPEEIAEFYHTAYHFYKNGKYSEAIDFFRTLTAIESTNVHYWTGLAASLKMQKQFQKSLDAYIVAGILNHQDPHIHAHAADCCFALGQIDRGLLAIELAEALAQKDKDSEEFISQLAVIKKAWSNIKNNKE